MLAGRVRFITAPIIRCGASRSTGEETEELWNASALTASGIPTLTTSAKTRFTGVTGAAMGSQWNPAPPVDYTRASTAELRKQIRQINDRLVEKGAPRPLISPTVTAKDANRAGDSRLALDEETKDLHSRHFAIKYALAKRNVEYKEEGQ